MPTVEAGGVSLYYMERGEGRTAVFVHGIPTDYRAWAAQMGPFSEGRRILALSRRYAAPNARGGDVADSTIQNNAADLKGFIESLGGGAVDLVGHSYGGFASAYLAAKDRDLVRSLVLVEPAVSTFLVADQKSTSQLFALLLKSPSVALSGRRFQNGSLKPSLKALGEGNMALATELNVDGVQDMKGAYAKLSEESKRMMLDNAKTIAELNTAFPRFTAAEASKIACPTLVVNGESSPLWLRRIGALMTQAIPGAKGVMISRARHFPHMENPEEFNSRVLRFLGEVP